MTYRFAEEFTAVKKEFEAAKKILLVAHSTPDGDTAGSVFALKEYLENFLGKQAVVSCSDPLPGNLKILLEDDFFGKEKIETSNFDLLVGCDAVERGFERIVEKKGEKQKIILFDHHTTLRLKSFEGDIVVNDEKYSSVCEMLYDFFDFHRIDINKKIATCLLIGILSDTGIFQHANTTPRVMEITANLMRRGASLSRVIQYTFKNRKLETLKLWGRALERAEINRKTGVIMSYVTREDLHDLGATPEDISSIAEMLNTVSETKFSLVLSEREDNKIKGSLRSEEYKNVDVSEIARQFRGGGHRLASGFEVRGKLIRAEEGLAVR